MGTTPTIETRTVQPYMAIRSHVMMSELGAGLIPRLHGEVLHWLQAQGVSPTGAPFIRYHVINMAGHLDIALGWPVAQAMTGNERIRADTLPAGRYAVLVYQGITNGINANRTLLEWGAAQRVKWDSWDDVQGDGFGARYERFLTEPDDEPDPSLWLTEVAIRLADAPEV